MLLPEGMIKDARTIEATADARTAAELMQRFNIGSLVVVDGERPVGMITDRDLALGVIGAEQDPTTASVSDYMNDEVVALSHEESVSVAAELLRRHGIRRLPVVDGDGRLVGIVTADDLLQHLASELTELACAVRRELSQEERGIRSATAGSHVFGKE